MHTQVVVGTIRDAHQLAPLGTLEAEAVLNVNSASRVVCTLLLRNVEAAHVIRVNTQVNEPVPAVLNPLVEVLISVVRVHEVLNFHLLELTSTENKVTGSDLVTERLTNLANTERRALTRSSDHIVEVHENTLSGLRAQEVQTLLIIDRAQVSLHQTGEVLRLSPLTTSTTVRASNLIHALSRAALLRLKVLQQVILTQTLVAGQALNQRVGEGRHVTGRLPHRTRQNNGGIQANHVRTRADETLPPLLTDVFLQLCTEGAVVPCGAGTAVNFTGLENKAAALRERNNVIEGGLFSHSYSFCPATGCDVREFGLIRGATQNGTPAFALIGAICTLFDARH